VRGLRVGKGEVDLTYRRRGRRTMVDVLHARRVKVRHVGVWPL